MEKITDKLIRAVKDDTFDYAMLSLNLEHVLSNNYIVDRYKTSRDYGEDTKFLSIENEIDLVYFQNYLVEINEPIAVLITNDSLELIDTRLTIQTAVTMKGIDRIIKYITEKTSETNSELDEFKERISGLKEAVFVKLIDVLLINPTKDMNIIYEDKGVESVEEDVLKSSNSSTGYMHITFLKSSNSAIQLCLKCKDLNNNNKPYNASLTLFGGSSYSEILILLLRDKCNRMNLKMPGQNDIDYQTGLDYLKNTDYIFKGVDYTYSEPPAENEGKFEDAKCSEKAVDDNITLTILDFEDTAFTKTVKKCYDGTRLKDFDIVSLFEVADPTDIISCNAKPKLLAFTAYGKLYNIYIGKEEDDIILQNNNDYVIDEHNGTMHLIKGVGMYNPPLYNQQPHTQPHHRPQFDNPNMNHGFSQPSNGYGNAGVGSPKINIRIVNVYDIMGMIDRIKEIRNINTKI